MYLSALLFGISANIDTFVLGLSYGVKKQQIRFGTNLIISLITFLGTLCSIGLGLKMAAFLSPGMAETAGGILLLLLGAYYCLKCLFLRIRSSKKGNSVNAASLSVASDPFLSYQETFALGLALTVNNAGMGIGASFAGIPLLFTSAFTFFLSALFLAAGNRFGIRFAPPAIQRYADLLSGLIIIALGIDSLL